MTAKNKIGLIAGEGKMPIYIARKATEKGYEVFVAGAKGNAKEEDFENCACVFQPLRLGQMGAAISFFKKHGVTNIFSNLMPDLRGAKFLASLKNMRPQHILSRVTEEFKKDGIEFENSALFLEDYMPAKGILSKRKPTEEEQKVVDFGYHIAKQIAAMDIGLTCVVSQNAVIAVEGMEGTDRCILRAGDLYREGADKHSTVAVVKVARPDQDSRFDLPVLGKGTVQSVVKAGFSVLAFEAEKTLVLDLEEVVALVDKHHLCLLAV